jgi:type I restriction enzyme R subunit
MTTGYDCPDLLNLGLFRPIFSPTDFIQIKGRGTRKHDFLEELSDNALKASIVSAQKTAYKLFDFFANCEYFEEKFNYDQVLKLPQPREGNTDGNGGGGGTSPDGYAHLGQDTLDGIKEETVSPEGMKVDRMFFARFEETVRDDATISAAIEAGQWDRVIDYVNREVFDKPEEYYTLDKLRQAAAVDRRLTLREILEKIFGLIPRFKSRDELLEEEFAKFIADRKPEEVRAVPAIRNFFKAYATSNELRHIIDSRDFAYLNTHPAFTASDFRAVPEKYRALIPEYVTDYVSLNQFTL